MATSGRMTIAFSDETKQLMEALVPPGQRTDFVNRAVRSALRRLSREQFRREMAECAVEMYDEIMALDADFTPLEEEVHRQI